MNLWPSPLYTKNSLFTVVSSMNSHELSAAVNLPLVSQAFYVLSYF